MTRKRVIKINTLMSTLVAVVVLCCGSSVVNAETTTCDGSPCESGTTTFNVNVHEILSVSITRPDSWATGNTGDFLRNIVGLSVTSNNGAGFTASMKSKDTTNLVNKADGQYTISTLPTAKPNGEPYTRGDIMASSTSVWGYSLGSYSDAGSTDASESPAGDNSSIYKSMSTNATTILYSASAAQKSQSIFLGAKATSGIASGTYSNTVVISVVSGVVDDPVNPPNPPVNPVDPTPTDPTDPVGPANPSDDIPSDNTPTQDNTNHRTVYTTVADNNDDTTTTTTEIADTYAAPQGVTTSTTSDINEGTPLATGLAVTAGVAAATGVFFFILARRRDEDEEEDETV